MVQLKENTIHILGIITRINVLKKQYIGNSPNIHMPTFMFVIFNIINKNVLILEQVTSENKPYINKEYQITIENINNEWTLESQNIIYILEVKFGNWIGATITESFLLELL